MDAEAVRRILTTFADSPTDLDMSRGYVTVQIRDEIISAQLTQREGEIFVEENGVISPARRWIIDRIARMPMLADRLLTYVPGEKSFVAPTGTIEAHIETSEEETVSLDDNAADALLAILERRPAGTASVVYLTSDAGEGKTTLINYLARKQAERYKKKEADWLLVPITLAGRTFMRFDDVIVGALMNRFRFNVLFFDSFVELIRLGVVVPALDGFEEMFVEGASGDAISALGTLMQTLQSQGTVLVAARKAYFEYKNVQSQVRLFDSLGNQEVTFAKLALNRWNREQFIEYARARSINRPEEVYRLVSTALGPEHSILTRAVLVRRLLDISTADSDLENLLSRVTQDPSNYFRQFVGTIVGREAKEKWLDKQGELAKPLITEDEHYELLGEVAAEMWSSGTEAISADVLGYIAEVFGESRKKDKATIYQIVERVRQHALLVRQENGKYTFDHEEFYHFFLGEAIGGLLCIRDNAAIVRHLLREAVLPRFTVEAAARFVCRLGITAKQLQVALRRASVGEPRISILQENACALLLRVIVLSNAKDISIENGSFPIDALLNVSLENLQFRHCYFQPSIMERTSLLNCLFSNCEFEGLDFRESTHIERVKFEDCSVHVATFNEIGSYDPAEIIGRIRSCGIEIGGQVEPIEPPPPFDFDERTQIMQRFVRLFLRSTAINENTLRRRLGPLAPLFFEDMLPALRTAGIIENVIYRGRHTQERFRLSVTLERVDDALQKCRGDFETFISLASA